MSPITIIKSNPLIEKDFKPEGSDFLEVAEMFCDTIQGENHVGFPATFLRLKNCTLNCTWCDSASVWKFGNPYTFTELFELMEKFDVINKFRNGQHLVLTGGSPLKQQIPLFNFIRRFIDMYQFKPYIEIENECTLLPLLIHTYIDCWNNSPKLSNSGNGIKARYKPKVLTTLSGYDNSWFKFVITCEEDWEEIQAQYLDTELIKKSQIVLMPEGETRKRVENNREKVLEIAIRENVRYTTREHVILWDKKTGV